MSIAFCRLQNAFSLRSLRRAALWLLSVELLLQACTPQLPNADADLAAFVNPFIGTGAHGHTYPGAVLPFGMVQLSPDTRLEGWDGCSGYHYTDTLLYGFSHTHLNGTGVPDYCDVLLAPFVGQPRFQSGADGQPGYGLLMDKSSERASPGYYAVRLQPHGIQAEMTATLRTGLHRYTFPAKDTAGLVLDLVHRDEVLDAGLWLRDDMTIEGYRISRAWAQEQHVYFSARFSRPVARMEIENHPGADSLMGKQIKAAFYFAPSKEPLVVQVAISPVDMQGARQNLDAEFAKFDFEATQQAARTVWNDHLRKIRASFASRNERTIFYTALYHALLQPNLFTDADGRYRGLDKRIHRAEDYTHYTVFSLWDTYRAAHPLYNLVAPERNRDFVRTMLHIYQQSGELPMWELAGNETYCMIGYHAASVIADAWRKGVRDFDPDLALKAMMATAERDTFGQKAYREYGFIPAELEAESVSKTLEYAYDDWCIAQLAADLDRQDVYETYIHRAQYYKNLFDRRTGFFRARRNQRWTEPFDPAEVNFHFTEANAWQYGFAVPHDIETWIELMGGPEKAAQRLDALFAADSRTSGREQADITGLIGQYAHGNEPSHHIAYLYNYCGQPWKTQARVQQIMRTQYANSPEGLAGNEDCGQMSAWYIFSALGFYPVTPGSNVYAIGSPLVRSAEIPLSNGKVFRIQVRNGGLRSPYIQSLALNGKPLERSYLRHEDILAGGTLEFVMGSKPNTQWATTERAHLPPSRIIIQNRIMPLPVVAKGRRVFTGQDTIELDHPLPDASIHYTTDGKDPDFTSPKYTQPIVIQSDTRLKFMAIHIRYGQSKTLTADFERIPVEKSIRLAHPYAPQYAASGPNALTDMLEGGLDFRTGEWQGFEGVNLDATIDLGAVQNIRQVRIRFLQDENAWIFMPLRVEFYLSTDGQNFQLAAQREPTTRPEDKGARAEVFGVQPKAKARYIRVVGHNRGVCPPWHKGAGGKAWLFADEISIE